MLYTINLDVDNYVLSLAHTKNDNVELDLTDVDLENLDCYQLIEGKLLLNTERLQLKESKERQLALKKEAEDIHRELESLDYIGIKIATGRATREQYTREIEHMNELVERLNEIENK